MFHNCALWERRKIKMIKIEYYQSDGSMKEMFYKKTTFSSGEIGITFDDILPPDISIVVRAEVVTPDDIMELMLISDNLQHLYPNSKKSLIIPYIPFGRQDRRTNGERDAFSLKVFANIVNSFKYDNIFTYSPHSQAISLLFDQISCLEPYDNHTFKTLVPDITLSENTIIVAPDNGAEKRCYKFAETYKIPDVYVCSKRRNAATGQITGMVAPNIPEDKDIIVVDDICDGGRTFIELEKVLPKNRKSLTLFVTHGIFSKGRQILLDSGYDNVYSYFNFIEKRLEQL